jgi:hypothetical protein
VLLESFPANCQVIRSIWNLFGITVIPSADKEVTPLTKNTFSQNWLKKANLV